MKKLFVVLSFLASLNAFAINFDAIPTRSNGDRILANWFNDIVAAGLSLENIVGQGFICEQKFVTTNNQSSAASITGGGVGGCSTTALLLDSTKYTSAVVPMEIRIHTSTTDTISSGLIKLFYRTTGSTWEVLDELGGDLTGVTLSITAGGQVQYTSTNVGGTGYAGSIKYKVISFAL